MYQTKSIIFLEFTLFRSILKSFSLISQNLIFIFDLINAFAVEEKVYEGRKTLFTPLSSDNIPAISRAAVAECVRRKFLYPNFSVKYSSTPFLK